jgi:hypothetical protein
METLWANRTTKVVPRIKGARFLNTYVWGQQKVSEQLLYTLSTLGTMSLDNFYNAFRVLCPTPNIQEDDADLKNARHQIIRFLSSLGHCEFDFEKRRVYACRPALVSLPGRGYAKAVLTGARTPALIQATRAYVADNKGRVSMVQTEQAVHSYLTQGPVSRLELPMSIVYKSAEVDPLEQLAETAGVIPRLDAPAAWSLVTFSASLADLKGLLNFERFRDLNWPRRVFSLDADFQPVVG